MLLLFFEFRSDLDLKLWVTIICFHTSPKKARDFLSAAGTLPRQNTLNNHSFPEHDQVCLSDVLKANQWLEGWLSRLNLWVRQTSLSVWTWWNRPCRSFKRLHFISHLLDQHTWGHISTESCCVHCKWMEGRTCCALKCSYTALETKLFFLG